MAAGKFVDSHFMEVVDNEEFPMLSAAQVSHSAQEKIWDNV